MKPNQMISHLFLKLDLSLDEEEKNMRILGSIHLVLLPKVGTCIDQFVDYGRVTVVRSKHERRPSILFFLKEEN
jgi:hypothetical protein